VERVIAYVDGFNFYFGLKASRWERYLWLNYQQLSQNLLRRDQRLVFTKYFTTRISLPLDKRKRQNDYIEALETLPDLKIFYGKYQMNPRHCRKCGFRDLVPNEKMTDVNIATELMVDAFQDRFDTALLMSADSDLIGPVVAVRQYFPAKRLVIAFPPQRYSEELKKVASAYFTVGRAEIAKSMFPLEVVKADGFVLKCPPSWQ
jgi:uncharacterized LabA/DUF88 family protein